MRRAVERRLAERREFIANARSYFRGKAATTPIGAAYIVGSVARGDFNLWSDVDVVVVADKLPERFLDRVDLFSDRPPGMEVFPYTPEEFDSEYARNNPIVVEASEIGIDLFNDEER